MVTHGPHLYNGNHGLIMRCPSGIFLWCLLGMVTHGPHFYHGNHGLMLPMLMDDAIPIWHISMMPIGHGHPWSQFLSWAPWAYATYAYGHHGKHAPMKKGWKNGAYRPMVPTFTLNGHIPAAIPIGENGHHKAKMPIFFTMGAGTVIFFNTYDEDHKTMIPFSI